MADLATARAAARLLTAHLDGDPASRAAELRAANPGELADATAELAAHMLAELTPPDRPGQIPMAMIHGLAAITPAGRRRAPRGAGSVHYDRHRGRWVAVVELTRDRQTGHRKRRKMTAATEEEARQRLAALLARRRQARARP